MQKVLNRFNHDFFALENLMCFRSVKPIFVFDTLIFIISIIASKTFILLRSYKSWALVLFRHANKCSGLESKWMQCASL